MSVQVAKFPKLYFDITRLLSPAINTWEGRRPAKRKYVIETQCSAPAKHLSALKSHRYLILEAHAKDILVWKKKRLHPGHFILKPMLTAGVRTRHFHQQLFQLSKRWGSNLMLPFWLLELGRSAFLHLPRCGFLLKTAWLVKENTEILLNILCQKIRSSLGPPKAHGKSQLEKTCTFKVTELIAVLVPGTLAAISFQKAVISGSSAAMIHHCEWFCLSRHTGKWHEWLIFLLQ